MSFILNTGPTMLLVGGLLGAAGAAANPRPLPFSYPYETLPQSGLEVEQFVDLTPVRTLDETGAEIWAPATVLITELEYGITDRLELGLYFQLEADPNGPLVFDGIKQRLRYRLFDAGELPVDVSLYAEVAEMHDEFELEFKVNLQRRFGPARVMVNLWAEAECGFTGHVTWVLHPTAGVTWELRPWLHLGVEYWMNAELNSADGPGFNADPHHFLGPAVSVQFKSLWWSVGPYLRLDSFGRAPAVGDAFGRVWVRSVIGLNL